MNEKSMNESSADQSGGRGYLRLMTLALLLSSGLLLSACDDGPAEETGEAVDNAVEGAADAVEDAGDAVEDATQ